MHYWKNSIGGYWMTLGLMLLYFVVLWVVWRLIGFIRFNVPQSMVAIEATSNKTPLN